MAQDEDELPSSDPGGEEPEAPTRPRRRRWRMVLGIFSTLLLVAVGYAWVTRERIADNLIAGHIEGLGLEATYDIEAIGPQRQILTNVVIGDPERPDLTIERIEVVIYPRLGIPGVDEVKLVRPRIYGTYRDDELSFGSLDPLIFAESEEPFRMPDLKLAIIDGRGLLETDFGPVGVKAAGTGQLRGGFAGELAAVAPRLEAEGCIASRASLYGKIAVRSEKPNFSGPVRLSMLDCPDADLKLANAGIAIDLTADKALDGVEGDLGVETGRVVAGGANIASLKGSSRYTYRKGALTARYDLAALKTSTPYAGAGSLDIEGTVRTSKTSPRIDIEGDISGSGLAVGEGLGEIFADARAAGEGTLVEPILAKIRTALDNEARDSSLSGRFILRKAGDVFNLIVPRGRVEGGSGKSLLSLSRFQVTVGNVASPRVSGNFALGGQGLPQVSGRMERSPGQHLMMHIQMPEYQADTARLAVPSLQVSQRADGGLGFAGEVRVSGALPGGSAEQLILPLEGAWSSGSGLSIWRDCTRFRFDRLILANLEFQHRALALCPPRGGAIVRSDAKGMRIAAGAPELDLSGRLGETPIHIASGPIGVAVPGKLAARSLDVTLGPADSASQFRIAGLEAKVGEEVAGTFDGVEVYLNAVPLDVLDTGGNWRFANGELTLTEASLRVEDREQVDRFQPLVAEGASLRLANNVITAEALLREPTSGREIVRTEIRHDLGTGRGSADLFADRIMFDKALQPDMVTRLALGVIANAEGVVTGQGRIDWNEQTVTSTGRFNTDALDFAAAFGPVRGVAGTVEFTDLLGLVTAPDQRLSIAAINPGIEVNDGELTFELRPDYVLAVKGARWPFLDGILTLQPVTIHVGEAEVLRYTLVMEGVDAAKFLTRMELTNLSATGIFDGTMPLIFDQDGGRIEGGLLRSRPPGGNVSYVGELTYKDLSAMANFAFDALRSLDYREMTIGMDGSLEGELVTRVRIHGVRQGEDASSNFITKQVSKLPIQFNINLRAPFIQLITSFKSLYDPAYVRDPRSLGLVDERGVPIPEPLRSVEVPDADNNTIQRSESGDMR